ncbi:hypothetical protein ACLNGM_20160 [Aureimonas phyllosphaerae]|uniref:hypothetical protein n=1 Tax=Aureimonas phyllosphaerae TaxID=1166078 RepID=UPI003A5BA203
MIEVNILEQRIDGSTTGRGCWLLLYPPRIGEAIQIPNVSPSTNFYEVIAVEHFAVAPEERRTPSSRQSATVTITVRYSYDWDDLEASDY